MGKTIQVSGFTSSVSAENVKAFLELLTGQGTVYAIKVRQQKNGVRAYAIVQFMSSRDAEYVIRLASSNLNYGKSYLKARSMETDIVPKPRMYLHTMENVAVRFGCQISEDRFSVLWQRWNVTVNFGTGLRTLQLLFSYCNVDYRLDLSYENIWQVELRRHLSESAKYLLIQLYGAPRIHEKAVISSGLVYDDPYLNYYKNAPDDHWLRATDFSPSSSIGQSSAVCVELPYFGELPNFRENFAFYRDIAGSFFLENGRSYSQSLALVPIVCPSAGVDLPFDILFKINMLVQNGCLSGPTLDANFYRLVDPCRVDIVLVENALEKLYHLKECCYDPVTWLSDQYRTYRKSRRPPKSPLISLDAGLVYVRRIQVTPTKVYFFGPEVNVSNRVLRQFHQDIDNFIRVSFVDEELDRIHSTALSPRSSSSNGDKKTGIYRRILSTLRNGIVIGNKKFEFLAFSSSQLRDNSAWMFASRAGLTASDIRCWMGDFHQIKNIAKYAARLGQSFGSSTESFSVGKEEFQLIPDVEIKRGGTKYVFSDGIGKISAQLANKVAKKCGYSPTPSAFQIRYGGYKGVVAVDPNSMAKLSLRESMCKYESENTKLDILAHSKYQPCYLNRQFITLLNTLGVEDPIFEKKQREAVAQLDAMLKDPLKAQEALELMSPGENTKVLKEMLNCGYKPDVEPFLSMMLRTFRSSKLQELRTKARIHVPQGRLMMGCLDETRTLEYGQVFVQISPPTRKQLQDNSVFMTGNRIVQRKVVVAKNPCLHPGDVRVLRAVDVPALHHMVDCVVFPQKGPRPHPNECSGSDLDGDLYFVCWDPELIPSRRVDPMDYTPPPSIVLDHDVTMEEVEEYFVNYILNDGLGIIANAHTAFADREPMKAMSDSCTELARLFSIAVDFPKTGVPAEIPPHLYVKEFPDFMEKPDKPTYESKSVIGKLYRQVKDIVPDSSYIRSFTSEVAMESYDPDMEVDGFEDYVDDAYYHKSNYDYKLGNLMDYYGIKTEAELLSGSIMKMSRSFTRKKDAEAIGAAVRSLRKEARTWFNDDTAGSDYEATDVFAKASAWYYVTYHPSYWGAYNEGMKRDHFLSFAWCIYDKLIHIKKEAKLRKDIEIASLANRLTHGLQMI